MDRQHDEATGVAPRIDRVAELAEELGVVPGSTGDSAASNLRVEIERAVDAAIARARSAVGDGVSRRILAGDSLRKIIEASTACGACR